MVVFQNLPDLKRMQVQSFCLMTPTITQDRQICIRQTSWISWIIKLILLKITKGGDSMNTSRNTLKMAKTRFLSEWGEVMLISRIEVSIRLDQLRLRSIQTNFIRITGWIQRELCMTIGRQSRMTKVMLRKQELGWEMEITKA